GAGGMGVVYEVFDTHKQAKVALKILPDLEPSGLYLFKQEFRGFCRVSHPNLVTLHELFCQENRWYFTMELVEGVRFNRYVQTLAVNEEVETQSFKAMWTAGGGGEEGDAHTTVAQGLCGYARLGAA